MAAVEGTIVATAMPTIVADLGGIRWFSWVFAAYFLTQAVTIPIYGKLADLYGRRNVFFTGVGIFLIGSVLCGFSRGMTMLIAFRALQGLGAGGVQPIAVTIVGDLCTPHERARVQGYISATWGVAAVLGPVLGALLLQRWTWAAVFWINVPIGLVCIAAFALFLREDVVRRAHRVDYAGSILLALGVGGIMFALVMAGSLPAGVLAGTVVAAVALLVVLFLHERRAAEPVVPIALWRLRPIAVANGVNFGIGMIAMGVTAFVPTYVQGVLGESALVGGIALGAMSVGWTTASVIAGRLMHRTTYRRGAAFGAVVLVAGGAALAALVPPHGAWWASAAATVLGLGCGFTNNVFIVSTQSSVGWEQRGAATAANMFMRQVGQAVGTSAFGAVFNVVLFRSAPGVVDVLHGHAAEVAAALHDVFVLVGVTAVAILLTTLGMPRHLGLATVETGSSSGSPA